MLEKLSFFSNLDNTQLDILTKISSVEQYKENYILHYEKTTSNKLLFLVDGLAKSYKIDKHDNEIFLYYIQKDSMLSELTDLKDDTLTAYSNIMFIKDSKVLSIEYTDFKKHFLSKNLLSYELLNEIIKRNTKLETLINREFIFDAVSKVAMMINTDLDIVNRLKRHDVALMLHIQPATLSRVLTRLKKDNLIDINQGKISIIDSNNLEIIYKEL